MIFTSTFTDVAVPDSLVGPYVLRHAEHLSDAPALVDGTTGRTLTYGDTLAAVKSLAGGLHELGFRPGDVLAIMAPNLPEYAVVFHGAVWAGGVVTTVNPTYTAGEVRHQLTDSAASILVTVSAFTQVAAEAAEGTGVSRIVTLDDGPTEHLADLMGAPLENPAAGSADDVVCLPYSSGTTGLSKGVMLTHRNLVANLEQTAALLPIAEGESVVSFLPFFHIYGMQVLMNGALSAGGVVVTMPRFDLVQFLELATQGAVRRLFVVPPVVLALANHPVIDDYDLGNLESVFSAAAPLGADLATAAGERLGCEVVQGYGMTEFSPVTHATPTGDFKPGSVGVLLPSTECRIVDPDTGDDLDIGGDGEVWIRGPQVMKGYLNNSAATAATIDDGGWLHTGDVGHVDADGHLTIVDRLKELIKYKAFQVPPAELEAVLVTHPAVVDAAVVGVPDPEAGEIPKAFVALSDGAEATAAEIQEYVADRVAHYKQIQVLEFVDEIPKSASGKILRRLLRDAG